MGDPDGDILRQKADRVPSVDRHIRDLIREMQETLREVGGLGLSAPQVGRSIRVLVAEAAGQAIALVNPAILEKSWGTTVRAEGCLSIPDATVDVRRPEKVRIRAQNRKGRIVTLHVGEPLSRVLQHEVDHLDGVLITDYLE